MVARITDDRPRCRAAGIPYAVRYRSKWRVALDQLIRGVDRATRLVEQMLQLARLEPESAARHYRPVVLADVVAEAVGGLANAFYIVGIAGVTALGALSVWVALSPSFRKSPE